MSTDAARRLDPAALPPRAGVALLNLQLRAALHDAQSAEAEAAGWDVDGAVTELRARLQPLVDQRRQALEQSMSTARADAESTIAAAYAEAAAIVAHADRTAESQTAALRSTLLPPQVAPSQVAAPRVSPETAWQRPGSESWGSPDPASIVVMLDADAFAKAFASAFGAILDERLERLTSTPLAGWQAPVVVTTTAPAPAKRSFWADTWHADVLLSVVAMIIVIAVLIAWST